MNATFSLRVMKLGLQHLFGDVLTGRRRHWTEHRLQSLSDRDLADMGIARRDIREIARNGANISRSSAIASRRADPMVPLGWAEALIPTSE